MEEDKDDEFIENPSQGDGVVHKEGGADGDANAEEEDMFELEHSIPSSGAQKRYYSLWQGRIKSLAKWKGVSPKIVAKAIRTSRIYSFKFAFVIVGIIFGIALCFIELGGDMKINQTAAIAIWMAVLWITEIIPLVVTALFPIVLFPLFGILSSEVVTAKYAGNITFLFMSGVFIAMALERWDLHRRFSLKVLQLFGCKPHNLMLGFMSTTFILSMFISNTAATIMMVPNVIQVIRNIENSSGECPDGRSSTVQLEKGVLLSIAYSANMGGMSSLIGTAPNLVMVEQLQSVFPDSPEISFIIWLGFALPIGVIICLFVYAHVYFKYLRNTPPVHFDKDTFKKQYKELGPWTNEQKIVGIMFLIEIILWMSRPAWSKVFPCPDCISDATVGMLIGLLLFLIPAKSQNLSADAIDKNDEDMSEPEITTLLDWKTANTMPWDIILLLGGGFALAEGFNQSGLSMWLGDELAQLQSIPTAALLFIFITLVIWLTEVTSNTATASIMTPIAASLAISMQVNPLTFMIPIVLACSCAFAFPVATPPNMVVFATGIVKMRDLNVGGIVLNPLASVVVLLGAYTFIPWVTGYAPEGWPSWAATSTLTS